MLLTNGLVPDQIEQQDYLELLKVLHAQSREKRKKPVQTGGNLHSSLVQMFGGA